MNKLKQVLNNTNGRFTTLVLKRSGANKLSTFCAKINSITDKNVFFEDVNTALYKKSSLNQVVFARSGQNFYRKSK